MKLLATATQGSQSIDRDRLAALLDGLDAEWFDAPRDSITARLLGALRLWQMLSRSNIDLVVAEGTGVSVGLPLLLASLTRGTRYVISSGDAVGPFIGQFHPSLGPLATLYERLLYRCSAGFIGWSPYLVGRALTFGAPYAMSAPGWAAPLPAAFDATIARLDIRARYGIPQDALVIGIVGSLTWNQRLRYCYGLELVRAAALVQRTDAYFLIVGRGSGLSHLQTEVARQSHKRVILTDAVPRSDVAAHIAAFDLASLPQSMDGVGSFRYTTKLPEYAQLGVPVVTGRQPLVYDLGVDGFVRMRARVPWSHEYAVELARLIEIATVGRLRRAAQSKCVCDQFDSSRQAQAVHAFLEDLVNGSQ